ncbi:hypothetical protein ACTQ54_12220 [Fundicoccus sp. Sow4_H7]|uniref:hypothetical protein n=1 Tax=Fundicoccus sp. Sow4_H7 TaxID=3438784 RepID=UPI003F909313
MYHEVTGNDHYLTHPKIKAIATFPYYAMIEGEKSVPFGDYNDAELPSGLLSYLHQKFDVPIPEIKQPTSLLFDHCYRFAHNLFNFKYSQAHQDDKQSFVHFFENRQWLVSNDKVNGIYFAARGGSNDESHNHIDLGNFVYGSPSHLFLDDLGSGEYTKDYFIEETRYKHFVVGATGHSIPLINGKTQQAGPVSTKVIDYRSSEKEVEFVLDLTNTYSENAELVSFVRKFIYNRSNGQLMIQDEFQFQHGQNQVTENFISRVKSSLQPTVDDGNRKDHLRVNIELEEADVNIHQQNYIDHFGQEATAYQTQATYYTEDEKLKITLLIHLEK